MTAYYNEIDPYAAQWLRNLIDAGHIAPGVVDERSIEDVRPDDLRGFTQCHFFAGIGVWSLALRRAGWPDDRPVWTGSCPCQPFSSAGEGLGFADERHLWPAFHWLIQERGPAVVFGEQVASSNVDPWLDLVQADVEALGHSFGCVAFPSAGIGAPHIRDRAYWVAYAEAQRRPGRPALDAGPAVAAGLDDGSLAVRLANTHQHGCAAVPGFRKHGEEHHPESCGCAGRLANMPSGGRREERAHAGGGPVGDQAQGLTAGLVHGGGDCHAGPTHGLWRDADWLLCRDGKWRPVEGGTFPLASGDPARVGRLRAYGNAINAEAARVFIEAVMASQP